MSKVFPTLWHRTATGAVNTWFVMVDGATVTTNWGQVDGARQEASFIALAKNTGKKNATTAEEQAVKEAEALVTKQLRKKYVRTLKELGSDDVKPQAMLAQDYHKRVDKLSWPNYCQQKLDGLRLLAHKRNGKIILQSRGNKEYNLPHIVEALSFLSEGTVLDGELFHRDLDLQTINSLVRRPRAESRQIQYWLYDIMTDQTYSIRRKQLADLVGPHIDVNTNGQGPLVILGAEEVHSPEDVTRLHAQFVEQGFEGGILRTANGKYRAGYRSPDLLKIKSWLDNEFRIIGWTTGKGKFQSVPIFRCVTDEGQEFDVSPTGTQEQRAEMLANADSLVGKMMTVKYFQMSPDNKPLYASALGIRESHE